MGRSICIVGRGTWGGKIQSSLEQKGNFCTTRVAAREFKNEYRKVKSSEAIWISSRPTFQLKILADIVGIFPGEIIIEKPYALNDIEYLFLRNLLAQHPNIHLSTPWLYSSLWAYFLQLFSDGEIKGLKGKRVSDFRRTYCSPVEDRLPHEIYLLQGLLQQAKVNNRKIGNINLTMDYTEDKCLGFLTSEVFPLWFEVGYGQKLEAFWLAQCESKEVKIDFTNHTIYYERKLRSFWEQRNSTIPKMVNAILDGHKVVCDQIELIDNLCKLTSQKGVI